MESEAIENAQKRWSAAANRNAVVTFSPGLPLRLPWDFSRRNYPTATRLRHFLGDSKSAQPRCGWDSTNLIT